MIWLERMRSFMSEYIKTHSQNQSFQAKQNKLVVVDVFLRQHAHAGYVDAGST